MRGLDLLVDPLTEAKEKQEGKKSIKAAYIGKETTVSTVGNKLPAEGRDSLDL